MAENQVNAYTPKLGLSTRVIGVMVMIHGDDKGLVLPPRIAKIQSILIPVGLNAKTTPEEREQHAKQCADILATLSKAGVRCDQDTRDGYTPAWKFNDWELKGVPLRLEFGPKDAAKEVVSYARRDTGVKGTIPLAELATQVPALLETIQADLYEKAEKSFRAHRIQITKWEEVVPALDARNVVIIPSCLVPECEDRIKELTKSEETNAEGQRAPSMGMKSLCIPFEQPEGLVKGETKCLNPECGRLADQWCMFGRSY
jgi:prolyl-tRNA synthetase